MTRNVTVTVTTGTKALVGLFGTLSNDTGGSFILLAYRVSGATTIAASDSSSLFYESSNANDQLRASAVFLRESLTAGSNTFTLQVRVNANTGRLQAPGIWVIPL